MTRPVCSGSGQFHSDKNGRSYDTITFEQICDMASRPQTVPKENARWMIPSTLMDRRFTAQEHKGSYVMLWADFDTNPQPIADISAAWMQDVGATALFYTSRSATTDKPKSRLIAPLNTPLGFSDWHTAQSALCEWANARGFLPDAAALRAAQLCYLPNRGSGIYETLLHVGENLDPITHLSGYVDTVMAKAARAAEQQAYRIKLAEERRATFNASGKESIIAWFNRAYAIEEVLLKAGYEQRGTNFRHPQSESGGYSCSVKGGRAFALSPNDALYSPEGAHDAFSAFAVLFFGGDQTAAAAHAHKVAKKGAA